MSSQIDKTAAPLLPTQPAGRIVDPKGMLKTLLNNLERIQQERPLYTGVPDCTGCNDELFVPGPNGRGVVRCKQCGPGSQGPQDESISKVTGSKKLFTREGR